MTNQIQSISLNKLVAHPDNPNRMSKANFAKLVRNIQRTGRYEPLVVRPCPQKNCHSCPASVCGINSSRNPNNNRKIEAKCFQIINGHHRCQALQELGYKTVDVVVWDIDDKDADILLATLNHLGGSDVLEKKLALLKRLNQRMEVGKLAKLLPQTAKQLHRLSQIEKKRIPQIKGTQTSRICPLVFFVNDRQKKVIYEALLLAGAQIGQSQSVKSANQSVKSVDTKAIKKSAALTYIAQRFITTVNQ